GLKEVRRVVEDCMRNVHPVYHVKELMIKRELAKDPQLAGESWDRFLPHFKKRSTAKRRVPHRVTDKSTKVYTPFPPPQQKSKVDLQIESGEFFLGRQAKERAEKERKREKMREKMEGKRAERERDFVPPQEEGHAKAKKRRKGDDGEQREKKKRKKEAAASDGA
ncbi:MAG: hypothetical protein INR71_01845, partial [Terriglobus roseus]|nr:hypothetical protein [Terriglobus roseus]